MQITWYLISLMSVQSGHCLAQIRIARHCYACSTYVYPVWVHCLLQCDAGFWYWTATTVDKARETAHQTALSPLFNSNWSSYYMMLLNWRDDGWICLCCASHLTSFSLHPHINRDQGNFRLNAKKKIMMYMSSFMRNLSDCQNLLDRHKDMVVQYCTLPDKIREVG